MWQVMAVVAAGTLAGCSAAATGESITAVCNAPRTLQHQSQAQQSTEALVPYADALTYPNDWVALSRRRLGE